MKKFPSINYPKVAQGMNDEELIVQEKIDGANFRFTVTEDEEILAGSRNVVFKENGEPQDIDNITKQFRHAVRYVQRVVELFEPKYTVYGEAMHKHSIDYDAWTGKHPNQSDSVANVVVFDVWDESAREWLTPSEVKNFCEKHNLRFVGIEDRVESVDDVSIPQSQFRKRNPDAESEFDRRGLAEGVVVKAPETGGRAKIVHDSFKEKKKQDGGSDVHKFVEMFVTEARIEKQAHKLVDEGSYEHLQMEMMRDLPQAVIEDILSEEGWVIMQDEHDIVLDGDSKGKIRSDTSSKCATVLRQMLL